MSANIYQALKKIVLPSLENFKTDLTVSDKEFLKKYKGKFLYAYRNNGTNIFTLDVNTFDYTKTIEQLQDRLANCLYSLKGNNKNFLFFDGETLRKIDWEKLHTIFGSFAKEVYGRKEYFDSLQIDLITLDLYCLMRDFKTRWRSIAINSDVACRRRFRNHFNYEKIKIPKDFKKISGYNKMENSEEIKKIKQQLMENLK
jgi:hypothetical protein